MEIKLLNNSLKHIYMYDKEELNKLYNLAIGSNVKIDELIFKYKKQNRGTNSTPIFVHTILIKYKPKKNEFQKALKKRYLEKNRKIFYGVWIESYQKNENLEVSIFGERGNLAPKNKEKIGKLILRKWINKGNLAYKKQDLISRKKTIESKLLELENFCYNQLS